MKKLSIKKIYDELKYWNNLNDVCFKIYMLYNTENGKYSIDSCKKDESFNFYDHIIYSDTIVDNSYIYSNRKLHELAEDIKIELERDIEFLK